MEYLVRGRASMRAHLTPLQKPIKSLLLMFPLIVLLIILPAMPKYFVHVITLILIYSFSATSWLYMARLGLISLGHGTFFGVGAYTSSLLFNIYDISPWIGMLVGGVFAIALGSLIGYLCFRFGVTGAYLSLITLALSASIQRLFEALRGVTGGLLGLSLRYVGHSPLQFQFAEKYYFSYIAFFFWLLSIYLWRLIENGKIFYAIRAIESDEVSAEFSGINTLKVKLQITIISVFLSAISGTIYAQTLMYISPEIAGPINSLTIAFIATIGGLYATAVGPILGSIVYFSISETLRVLFGGIYAAFAQLVLGVLIVIITIFSPGGLYEIFRRRGSR